MLFQSVNEYPNIKIPRFKNLITELITFHLVHLANNDFHKIGRYKIFINKAIIVYIMVRRNKYFEFSITFFYLAYVIDK